MIKIDLDRLHKQPKIGRGSGKTFDMVVEVLHNVYFSKPGDNFIIRVRYLDFKRFIIPMIRDVAESLDIEIDYIKNGGTQIFFKNKGRILFKRHDDIVRGLTFINFSDPE